jgi:hypothetical protein
VGFVLVLQILYVLLYVFLLLLFTRFVMNFVLISLIRYLSMAVILVPVWALLN